MPVLITTLKQLDFFKNLSDQDLLSLSMEANYLKTNEKITLIKAGATLTNIFFTMSGQLQTTEFSEDSRVIGVHVHNPGSIIGIISLIDGGPINYTTICTKTCELVALPAEMVKNYVYTRPELAQFMLKHLAQKIRHLNFERSILSQPNAYHRIFMQLNQLALAHTRSTQPLNLFSNQKEIASMVNTSRETVSRALQLLIKNGILIKSGRQIVIRNQESLEKLAVDGLDALNLKK